MLRWFSKPLSVRQMRLLCASLLAGFALCGALQGLCWGRTQLDTGAALCADTLRLHIRAASDAVADQISQSLEALVGTTDETAPKAEPRHPVRDTTTSKFANLNLQFGRNYDPTHK